MIEFQIVVNVYSDFKGGQTSRHVIRTKDRESAINKFKYLTDLVKDSKKKSELAMWTRENIGMGVITSIEGLFGVSYIQIL